MSTTTQRMTPREWWQWRKAIREYEHCPGDPWWKPIASYIGWRCLRHFGGGIPSAFRARWDVRTLRAMTRMGEYYVDGTSSSGAWTRKQAEIYWDEALRNPHVIAQALVRERWSLRKPQTGRPGSQEALRFEGLPEHRDQVIPFWIEAPR